MTRTLVLWFAGGFAALAALLWGLPLLWQGLGAGITGHGWIAYVLGGVLTVGLSIGLMLLSFYSARHGYDDIDPPGTDGPA